MRLSIQLFVGLFLITITGNSLSQDVYNLWEGQEKPYYKENNLKEYEKESWGVICAYNITESTLTVYRAEDNNTGKSVVIIPGGGYAVVAIYHEGHDIARVLAKQGITAAVLKYRLPNPESSDQPHLVPLSDARRALKLLRSKSEMYGINKERVKIKKKFPIFQPLFMV